MILRQIFYDINLCHFLFDANLCHSCIIKKKERRLKLLCYKCGLEILEKDPCHGLHPTCFKQWFSAPPTEDFKNVISRHFLSYPSEKSVINSSFFHGKFRKYSATLGKHKYILKIEEKDYPELPVTEYLCNQIFSSLYIPVPSFYLISFQNQHSCFVTKNFMGNFISSNLVHIYHFLEKDSNYNCEHLLQVIEAKTGKLTSVEHFVYLTLADSLIGNNDRHGRNLALIQTSKGFLLSPFYDNPSYLGCEIPSLLAADHQPVGAIQTTFSKHPSMKDYVQEWTRLGFEHVIDRFRKNISVEKIQNLVQNSYLTPKRKEAFLRLILKRNKELCL